MNQPSVAIVLVNWNGYKDTIECLESLNSIVYSNFKVFVVDNCSTNNSFEYLVEEVNIANKYHYAIELIKTDTNLGFAGGNNVALKKGFDQGFDYFWLLNNDTTVDPKALSSLVSFLQENNDVGITGSKIYYYNTNVIWFAGGKFDKNTGKIKHIGYKTIDDGSFEKASEVDYITGCSMFFRRKIIEQIGFISEDYFLYYEETDFNIKARIKGWKIKYNPDSIVYHKVSVSSGGEERNQSPYVAYYDIRNGFWVCKRNFDGYHIMAMIYMFYKSCKKLMKILLLNQPQKFIRVKYVYNGIKDALRG